MHAFGLRATNLIVGNDELNARLPGEACERCRQIAAGNIEFLGRRPCGQKQGARGSPPGR